MSQIEGKIVAILSKILNFPTDLCNILTNFVVADFLNSPFEKPTTYWFKTRGGGGSNDI